MATVIVVWTTSAIISVPPLIGWNAAELYDESTQRCHLTDDRGFVLYSAAGSFYGPLALMTFVYAKIYLATRRRLRARTEKYRVTATTTSAAVASGAAVRVTPDSVLPTPSRRDSRPEPELMDVPSIESLTNYDDYDNGKTNDIVESRSVAASATCAASCWRPETEMDNVFKRLVNSS